jgi:Ca2+:H+ antiporter
VNVRRLLWASTVLAPLDVVAALLGLNDSALFVVSALALVPLAWVIGESTEQVGEHTGPTVAGFLNASFGNAPELMVSLFAVNDGLHEVVRGSLTGSVVGNLLLVLGFSLYVGRDGPVRPRAVVSSLRQVGLAVALFLVPASVHWVDGSAGAAHFRLWFAVPPMVVLLLVYVVGTARDIRTQHREHQRGRSLRDAGGGDAEGSGRDRDSGRDSGPDESYREDGDRDGSAPEWSLPRSLVVLALATAATVAATEILTRTIESFADATGLGDFLTAAVIVAIVGNAAEHGGAVVIAARGNTALASEIALGSAAQVALFVLPLVVLLSLAIRPLPLDFRWVELAALGVAVALPAVLLRDARSARWKGASLCAGYAAVAALFYAG